MDTLKVMLHAADEGGCGHYRMIWPGQAVASQDLGIDVEVVTEGQLTVSVQENQDGTSKIIDVTVPDCDVLVLQRPLRRELTDAIPLLQAKGVAVVVELDDDFQAIHRNNTAWAGCQPHLSPDRNWKWLQRACHLADLVTVTTPNLARKYGNDNTRVIPNYLPAHAVAQKPWKHPRDTRPLHFTWTGSVATHPTDLQVASAGFQTMAREGWGEAHIIGTGKGVASRLGLGNDRVVEYRENEDGEVASLTVDNPLIHATGVWVDIDQYPNEIGRIADVGVVPLADIPFNEGKSWLKGLEFAGQGRPFIASSTGPYRELAEQHGLGVIAKKPRDWIRLMRRFHDDPDWAQTLAATGLAYVQEHMTYEANAWRWAAVWAEAASRRKGTPRSSATLQRPHSGPTGIHKALGLVPITEEMMGDARLG